MLTFTDCNNERCQAGKHLVCIMYQMTQEVNKSYTQRVNKKSKIWMENLGNIITQTFKYNSIFSMNYLK